MVGFVHDGRVLAATILQHPGQKARARVVWKWEIGNSSCTKNAAARWKLQQGAAAVTRQMAKATSDKSAHIETYSKSHDLKMIDREKHLAAFGRTPCVGVMCIGYQHEKQTSCLLSEWLEANERHPMCRAMAAQTRCGQVGTGRRYRVLVKELRRHYCCGRRIRTYDLLGMSQASYYCSIPRCMAVKCQRAWRCSKIVFSSGLRCKGRHFLWYGNGCQWVIWERARRKRREFSCYMRVIWTSYNTQMLEFQCFSWAILSFFELFCYIKYIEK